MKFSRLHILPANQYRTAHASCVLMVQEGFGESVALDKLMDRSIFDNDEKLLGLLRQARVK
jgi:hypothetical protein